MVLLFALSFSWVVDRSTDEVAGTATVPSTVSPSPAAPPRPATAMTSPFGGGSLDGDAPVSVRYENPNGALFSTGDDRSIMP